MCQIEFSSITIDDITKKCLEKAVVHLNGPIDRSGTGFRIVGSLSQGDLVEVRCKPGTSWLLPVHGRPGEIVHASFVRGKVVMTKRKNEKGEEMIVPVIAIENCDDIKLQEGSINGLSELQNEIKPGERLAVGFNPPSGSRLTVGSETFVRTI